MALSQGIKRRYLTQKFFEFHAGVLKKVPFWPFFREGRDGHALLVQPSKMHYSIGKIIFVLGADEYLERLDGKRLKYSRITVGFGND